MLFDPADVEFLDTWYTTGLAGSGSNDYRVTDIFVPDEHTFHVFDPPKRPEPLYAYHGFFFANVPGIPFGLARAALDEAQHVAATKRSFGSADTLRGDAEVQVAFGEAEAILGASRAYVADVIGAAWATLLAGDSPTVEQRSRIGLCIVHAGRSAQQVIDIACGIAGSSALYRKSPLERVRRDMIAAGSHLVHQRKTYGMAGRPLLGVPAGITFF